MKEQEVEGTYFDLGMVSEEYKIECTEDTVM